MFSRLLERFQRDFSLDSKYVNEMRTSDTLGK